MLSGTTGRRRRRPPHSVATPATKWILLPLDGSWREDGRLNENSYAWPLQDVVLSQAFRRIRTNGKEKRDENKNKMRDHFLESTVHLAISISGYGLNLLSALIPFVP